MCQDCFTFYSYTLYAISSDISAYSVNVFVTVLKSTTRDVMCLCMHDVCICYRNYE